MTPAPSPLKAEEQAASEASVASEPLVLGHLPSFAGLRARLDRSDRALAVRALEMALTEIGDGATAVR